MRTAADGFATFGTERTFHSSTTLGNKGYQLMILFFFLCNLECAYLADDERMPIAAFVEVAGVS